MQFDDQSSWRIYCSNGNNPAEESNNGQYRSGEIYAGACEVKNVILYLEEVFDEPNLSLISRRIAGDDLEGSHFEHPFSQSCPQMLRVAESDASNQGGSERCDE